MFGSMFETAAYHRGLQWPPPPSCGYSMSTFDAVPSSSRLTSSVVPHGHVPQSGGYPSTLAGGEHHARYAAAVAAAPGPLYDGPTAVRDALFGCRGARFSDPSRGGSSAAIQTGASDDGRQQSSSSSTAAAAAAFSPLSLPLVGPSDAAPTSSDGGPRLPATPYGYGATPTDDRYYVTAAGAGGGGSSAAVLTGDLQSAGCGQSTPTTGFRSPALSLGFNPRRFVNDVIGQCFHLVMDRFSREG